MKSTICEKRERGIEGKTFFDIFADEVNRKRQAIWVIKSY
jgi:hypothetical protein